MGRTINEWFISIGEFAGGYALWQYGDYLLNRAVMSKLAPLSAWSAGIYVTHKTGQTISKVIDPDKGEERWNEYILDPLGSIPQTHRNISGVASDLAIWMDTRGHLQQLENTNPILANQLIPFKIMFRNM